MNQQLIPNKELIQKELERSKYILKDFERNGIEAYEKHKDLVIEFIKNKLKEDVKYFQEKLNG